jgi:hypothetical protein
LILFEKIYQRFGPGWDGVMYGGRMQ